MNMNGKQSLALWSACLVLLLAPASNTHAAEGVASAGQSTGSITGRVQNVVTGNYLNQARITVKGSEVIAYTDEFGIYRLVNLRSGPNVIEVFYTDLDPQEITIHVPSGGSVEQNVELTSKARYGEKADIVKLSNFVVSSDRETDGMATAVNEQRFAPNIKNVLSSDSFGDILGGNVGEFLKFIPGLTTEYSQVEIVGISVRGLGSDKTSFTADGAAVVSATAGQASRAFNMNVSSLNNISRVEVTKVPTPSTPADSLGGSVNMISKSAFERTRRQFNFSLSQVANSENLTYKKTPHSFDDTLTRKIRPGWDFDYTQPIGKNFGIILTGFQSDKFNEQHLSTTTFNSTGTSTGASFSRPFLQQYLLQDAPRSQMRTSFSFKADWRVTPNSVLSLGAQYNKSSNHGVSMNWTIDTGTNGTPTVAGGVPLTFGENFTTGATGRGTVTMAGGGHPFVSDTNLVNLNYRFDDGRWKVEAGVNQSTSTRERMNTGQFAGFNSTLINPARVSFSNIEKDRPGGIQVFDNNNREIDIYDIRNYRGTTVTLVPYDNSSLSRSANLNVKRRLNLFPFPFAVQGGTFQSDFRADTRTNSLTLNYNGLDGDPTTADTPEPFLTQNYRNMDSFYGFKNIPWTSAKGGYTAYLANPRLFSSTAAQLVASENARLAASEYIQERVSAFYIQAEARLLNNRLNVLTGVRFEKTTDEGEGSQFDANAVWVRDPDGTFARNAAGVRIRKTEAGLVGSMEELRLTRQERAFKNKRSYDGYFPSLHLTYNIRENFQARLAYAKTYGRPGYADVIPNATFAERDLSDADFNNPDVIKGTVTIRNTALKPWSADNYDFSLEYYTQSGGMVSGGVFLKEIKDFFGSRVIIARLEDLEAVGLDPRYVNWNLATKFNSGSARIRGAEFNLRQSLRNLGPWGSHFTVFANGTKLDLEGESKADFTSFIPKSANWGVSFSRKRITLIAKWNYRGLEKRVARPAFGPDGFEYFAGRVQLDLNGAFQINKNFSLNLSVGNALNVPQVRLQYGSETPEYARQSRTEEFGIPIALGIRGSF